MSLFSANIFEKEYGQFLQNDRVILRLPRLTDFNEWAELRLFSADFLKPFEPQWPKDYHTQNKFKERVKRYKHDASIGIAYHFLIHEKLKEGERIVGGITLTNIRFGAARAVTLGYWTGRPYVQQGFMSEAVDVALKFIFQKLDLFRAEAACLIDNDASIRLLQKTGFEREGRAQKYLLIDGNWQDHWLYGLNKDQYLAIKQAKASSSVASA